MTSQKVSEAKRDRFARKWFSEWCPDPAVYRRASQLLDQFITHKPEVAWDLLLKLIHAAPDNNALACVGAGPLEDLLCHHGAIFIERVETTARNEPDFVRCLAHVWGENRMDSDVHVRVQRILK
jgi:hypothetical protein